MKKYAKILSILLCLSMLVGMIAMVATAEDPATPVAPETELGAIKQGTIHEIVSPTKLTAYFGYYEEEAIYEEISEVKLSGLPVPKVGYYEDGELIITRGTPASMPMYNAVQEVTKKAIEIAREVF